MGNVGMVDFLTLDGLNEVFYGYHMGMILEKV